jgi:hypothetical protein
MRDYFKELELISKLTFGAGVNQRRLLYELYKLKIITYLRDEDLFEREGVREKIAKKLIKKTDICVHDYLEAKHLSVPLEYQHQLKKDPEYVEMLTKSNIIYNQPLT